MKCVLSPEVDAVLVSVGPRVLLSRGARFQLSRSALGLSTLRAPSNAGCASLGARVPAPLYAGPGISRPRAGALSPQTVLSVVSAQVSAACAEWLEESTEGESSGACVVLRAFRQLRGVLRALTFSAFIAPPEDRKGGKNRLIFNRRARPKRVQFVHVLVQACYPALAHFTQKNAKKV